MLELIKGLFVAATLSLLGCTTPSPETQPQQSETDTKIEQIQAAAALANVAKQVDTLQNGSDPTDKEDAADKPAQSGDEDED